MIDSKFSRVLWILSILFLIIALSALFGGEMYRELSFFLFMDTIVFAIAAYYLEHKHSKSTAINKKGKS